MNQKRVRIIRAAAPRAAALAFGVVGFELLVHASRGEVVGAWGPHLFLDAILAFPLALVAMLLGRHLGSRNDSWNGPLVSAVAFILMLIPSVSIHEWIHSWLQRDSLQMAGHPLPNLSTQIFDLAILAHGAKDAVMALPLALLICMAQVPRLTDRRSRLAIFLVISLAVPPTAHAAGPVIVPFNVAIPIPATLTSPDITLTAQQTDLQILPGSPTRMWTYNGSFPGPVIRRPSGEPTRVTLVNQLPSEAGEITLHHHGNHSASTEDGQPHEQLIPAGGSRTYTYDFMENDSPERGAFQWYHDHRMDVTGRNVWKGLAGMVILDDPAEAAIDSALPNGQFDVPMMITDRTFDQNNQIPYKFSSDGVIGSTTLVNGAPQPFFEVADRKYRLRLLNASNSRTYNLALSDGRPMVQVAAESGLLPAPVTRDSVLLGPAERAEVIVDFGGALGSQPVLRNLAGSGLMSQVMQFRVTRDESDASFIPSTLRTPPAFDEGSLTADRTWILSRDIDSGMWMINGKGFDHNRVDARPVLGTTERWTFINVTTVDHIVHIHDVDWRIVQRTGGIPADISKYPDESGLKESFRLRGGEAVTVISRFTDHLGRYVLHCHMLEHEDFAMMAQFEVIAPQ